MLVRRSFVLHPFRSWLITGSMRQEISVLVSAGILLLGGLCTSMAVTISGSDLLGPAIEEALGAELSSSGTDGGFEFDGSLLGVKSLEDGDSVAAILALSDDTEKPGGLTLLPIGYQVAAFAVHAENPVSELTYSQLSAIYADSGPINSWGDISDDAAWKERGMTIWAARSSKTMSLELFNAVVIDGSLLKQSVRYSTETGSDLLNLVREDSAGIVLVPQIEAIPSVRFLAIKADESGQAYTPSADNIFFGDYPLRLPFYLAVSESSAKAEIASILRGIFSAKVTEAMEAAGFVPLPVSERRSILSQFE